jgi:hypothetical protein
MNPLFALLPSLVCFGVILACWGALRFYRRARPARAEDQRLPEWVKVFLVLFVVWLVVEIIAIQTLGGHGQHTFERGPQQTPERLAR